LSQTGIGRRLVRRTDRTWAQEHASIHFILTQRLENRDGAVPDALARLNWILLDDCAPETAVTAEALAKIESTINLGDTLWLRGHTEWTARAAAWDAAGRANDMVLRAAEITGAQLWMSRRASEAPSIPEVVTAFVDASVARELLDRRRTRRLQVGVGAALTAGALLLLGTAGVLWKLSTAQAQRNADQLAQLASVANILEAPPQSIADDVRIHFISSNWFMLQSMIELSRLLGSIGIELIEASKMIELESVASTQRGA
jgi:hypothetical protein